MAHSRPIQSIDDVAARRALRQLQDRYANLESRTGQKSLTSVVQNIVNNTNVGSIERVADLGPALVDSGKSVFRILIGTGTQETVYLNVRRSDTGAWTWVPFFQGP